VLLQGRPRYTPQSLLSGIAVLGAFLALLVSFTTRGADRMTTEPAPAHANMAAIVALITLTRWIFLLPQSFISGSYAAMALFAVLMVPVFFYFLGGYREVKMFWDSGEVIPLVRGENFDDKMKMAGFYRQELMCFILGSMVASVVLPFRLVRAAWRKYNLHKV